MAEPSIVITQIADVPESPVNRMTVEHDQGWTRGLIQKAINGSPDLFVSVFRMEPNQVHPKHRHANVGECYFVLEGRAEMTVGDRVEWVETGTAIYVPKGVPHGTRTGEQGFTTLVIYPEGDWDKVQKEFVE
jgi:quercetin dioxygenase-like cupin family protein